jgi:hypothetical protein
MISPICRVQKIRMQAFALVVGYLISAAWARNAFADNSTPAQAAPIATESLSADDVSWLFPAPKTAADFKRLIAVADLTTQDPQDPNKRNRVWSDAAFNQFLQNAAGPAAQIEQPPSRISLPDEAKSIGAWFVVGLRLDPGAPGLSQEIRTQFGQLPEIRLVAQPVIKLPDGSIKVFDTAAHLIFDFVVGADTPFGPDCFPRPKPNMDEFRKIVADFAALRTKLENGDFGGVKVKTAGLPLGVHPGLKDSSAGAPLRDALKAVLEQHLSNGRLGSMAIMALPDGAPEPWMFLSMLGLSPQQLPPNGGYVPVRSPALDGARFVEALAFDSGLHPRPAPAPNNLNPITCRSAAVFGGPLPIAGRKGAATAELFQTPPPAAARVKEVTDLIADPSRSHFFNTDCVSCHTETRRSMSLSEVHSIAGVDDAVLPQNDWNVRNLGWFPSSSVTQETATRRTAAETAAVVDFINNNLLMK